MKQDRARPALRTGRCPVCGRTLGETAAVVRLRGLTVHRHCAVYRRRRNRPGGRR